MTLTEALGLLLFLSMLAVLRGGSSGTDRWQGYDIGPALQRKWIARKL